MTLFIHAQNPNPALVGYWQNWNDASSPYIDLDQVDSRYNIINISFAVPHAGTDYQMEFIPDQTTQANLISQVQSLQSNGKKVIISIGGATAPISLDNITERDTFISTMEDIIDIYHFDGIDIDLEGSSLSLSGGTVSSPVDQPIINLIDGIKQIMHDYYTTNNRRLVLSLAPETSGVQGGMSAFSGPWGSYLPILEALKDSIELLHVQLYNSGTMYGIDGGIYAQGTTDFIVAMTESVIQGFTTTGGTFSGLSADKIVIGLPACVNAAGGGYTDPDSVKAAINYLRGTGPKPGVYILANANGYPDLRGMMTWSINWDAANTCGQTYEYATAFENIFGTSTSIVDLNQTQKIFDVYPNPSKKTIIINVHTTIAGQSILEMFNALGETVLVKNISPEDNSVDISNLPTGIYLIKFQNTVQRFLKQ